MSTWSSGQNISETVRDRNLVPKDHQYEMANAESNGHVIGHVTLKGQGRVPIMFDAYYLENG